MNIFVLDLDIERCARYHADRHVVKMILESAQILCTVLYKNGIPSPYRPTHSSHPCTLWAGRSLANWLWLRRLAVALNREYRYRYRKEQDHASTHVARQLLLPPIADIGLTEFEQVMPERYRIPGDAVEAYRSFYIGEKAGLATWTRRRAPEWFVRGR